MTPYEVILLIFLYDIITIFVTKYYEKWKIKILALVRNLKKKFHERNWTFGWMPTGLEHGGDIQEISPGTIDPRPGRINFIEWPSPDKIKKLIEESLSPTKKILKQAIADASLPAKICLIQDLHPTTLKEVKDHIHQIQNILIAEYVRYTELKDEIGLR
jgi:hypothetical protein